MPVRACLSAALSAALALLASAPMSAAEPPRDGFDAAVRSALAGINAPGVEVAEAARLVREEHAIVLDTRTEEEFRVSHLAGARFVPFGWWQALAGPRLPKDLPRDRPVLVVCTVGWRSGKVAQALVSAGQPRVFNLIGGVLAWQRAGLPLVDAAGRPTRAVHPYNAEWGRYVRRD